MNAFLGSFYLVLIWIGMTMSSVECCRKRWMLAIEIKRLRSYLHEPNYDSLITLYGVFGVASLTGVFRLGSSVWDRWLKNFRLGTLPSNSLPRDLI